MSPEGGAYTAESPYWTVPVTITFTDPDGLNGNTFQVRLWTGSSSTTVPLTWSSNFDGVRGTATGNLDLIAFGNHVLVAQVADKLGNVGSIRAEFSLTAGNPLRPAVYSPNQYFHSEYRDTSAGAMTLAYPGWSYPSMGTARGTTLLYSSELAKPTTFFQVDAYPRDQNDLKAISLRVETWNNGAGGTLRVPEVFYAVSREMQRLGQYWPDETSTAYTGTIAKNWAVVRTYRPDNTFNETRFPIRFLILNEAYSRYGSGWIVAGVKRLWEYPEGVLMHEGDGKLRFFLKSCTATTCSYVTPAGDFSRLVKNFGGTWSRTYPDGSQVAFSAQGLMTSGTDAAGHTTTVEWQSAQDGTATPVLSRIVDPLGLPTTFEYDSSWYLKSFTIPGGRTVNVTMNSAKQISAISGPVNLSLSYTGRLLTSYTEKYGTADPGVTTDVTYDEASKLRSVTAAAVTANGETVQPQTTFRSVESIVVPKDYWVPGKQLTVDNRATEVNSDQVFGQATDPEGHITKFVLDGFGNATKVVDPAGRVTTSRYNAHGLLESFISTNEATSNIWDRNGNLLQSLTNGKVVYEASYGPDGRPVFEMNGKDARWYEYGSRGEVARTWYGRRDDYNRTATRYEYNSRYQLTATIDPKGLRTEWSYENNAWKSADHVRSMRDDGTYATTSFTYDTLGRIQKVTNPLNETSTTEYDSADRPTRVLDALGRATTYDYTGAHLTKVTDTAGKAYTFSYNALGWLEYEGFPDGGTRTYKYDRDGLTTSSKNRRGMVASQTYDAIHRPVTVTADGLTTSYTYTGNHTTVVSNAESVVTTKTVERVGNLDSVSATLGGKRFEIKNIYDGADGLRYIGFDLNTYIGDTYVNNSNKKMRFGVDFRPTNGSFGATYSLTDLTGRTTTTQMDTAGRPASITLPNSLTQSYSFLNDGRLSGTSFSTAAVNQKLGATFAWDGLNRLNTRTSANEDRYWSYAYNSVGQVTRYGAYTNPPQDCTTITTCRPTKIREETYTYDAAGNRTDRAAAIVSGTNRYSSFNGYSLEYDADGNVTRKHKTGHDQRFTWNTFGQLTGVTTNGVSVTYGYDGLGRRVRRTENGQFRYFLYNGDDLLLETDGSGEPLRMYTHWPGVDNPHSVRATSGGVNATYYYVTEHPGHVSGLINEAGTVVSEYRYTPWGEIESASDSTGQPLRYMAREIDTATGLYYVRARWYDPSMGRFASQDPIGLAGGMNTYAYSGSDPVNRLDPSGQTACKSWIRFTDDQWRNLPDREETVEALKAEGICVDVELPDLGPADISDFFNGPFLQPPTNVVPFSGPWEDPVRRQRRLDRERRDARREALRKTAQEYDRCTATVHDSSWLQDAFHEAKLASSWLPIMTLAGAGVGSVVPIAGTGAGAVAGFGLGVFNITGGAAWEATINRAGDRKKKCGGYFAPSF